MNKTERATAVLYCRDNSTKDGQKGNERILNSLSPEERRETINGLHEKALLGMDHPDYDERMVQEEHEYDLQEILKETPGVQKYNWKRILGESVEAEKRLGKARIDYEVKNNLHFIKTGKMASSYDERLKGILSKENTRKSEAMRTLDKIEGQLRSIFYLQTPEIKSQRIGIGGNKPCRFAYPERMFNDPDIRIKILPGIGAIVCITATFYDGHGEPYEEDYLRFLTFEKLREIVNATIKEKEDEISEMKKIIGK